MKSLSLKKGLGLLPAIRKFAVFDWILVVCMMSCAYLVRFSAFPDDFEAMTSADISGRLHTDTVTYLTVALFVYFVGGFTCAMAWSSYKCDHTLSKVLAAYFVCVSLSALTVSVIQRVVGRPLPDTIAACGGDGSFRQCANVLSPRALSAQFKSFPNPDSAEVSAAVTFLVLMLIELWPGKSMFSALATFFPVVFAAFVSGCAILDRRAHGDDVAVGLIIGAISGVISWNTFWNGRKQENTSIVNPLGTRTMSSADPFSPEFM